MDGPEANLKVSDLIGDSLWSMWIALGWAGLPFRLARRRRERELVRVASLHRPGLWDSFWCRLLGHPGSMARVTYEYVPKAVPPVNVTSFGEANKHYLLGQPQGWHRIVGPRRCSACWARS